MPQWNKHELYRAYMDDGHVEHTQLVRTEWFETGKGPELYILDDEDCMWASTNDYVIAANKPTD